MSAARRWRRLLGDLFGRTEADIADALGAQVDAALAGAAIARAVADDESATGADARERIRAAERQGDERRAELVALLSSTLVTPFDREDLFRLSRSIDDVLDNLRDFVRERDLFAVVPGPGCAEVIDAVIAGLGHLHEAVADIPRHAGTVPLGALATKKASNQIRRSYQMAVADLLRGPVTDEMLKRRELLRRLDVVGLRLGEAADALADGAVKRAW